MGNRSESSIFISHDMFHHDSSTGSTQNWSSASTEQWSQLLPQEQQGQEGLVTNCFWQG